MYEIDVGGVEKVSVIRRDKLELITFQIGTGTPIGRERRIGVEIVVLSNDRSIFVSLCDNRRHVGVERSGRGFVRSLSFSGWILSAQ